MGGWADPTLTRVGNTCRLTSDNHRQDASAYHAATGGGWNKMQRSDDISGFQHNVFGGFVSVRPGIFTIGQGSTESRHVR